MRVFYQFFLRHFSNKHICLHKNLLKFFILIIIFSSKMPWNIQIIGVVGTYMQRHHFGMRYPTGNCLMLSSDKERKTQVKSPNLILTFFLYLIRLISDKNKKTILYKDDEDDDDDKGWANFNTTGQSAKYGGELTELSILRVP